MSNHLARIADRVLNRPLLILPDKLAIITEVLAGRIGIDAAAMPPTPDASRFAGSSRQGQPFQITTNGTAIVTITGSLVNRGAWVGASSGLTSYEGIAFQIESAARDPKVKSILLDIESPGGEAVGAFETADLIRKAGQEKPIYAIANGMAASAAYAIASAARAIVVTQSAMIGSIGVVLMHADYSRAVDRAGITPTMIFKGKKKTAGNPYEPLSPEVKADLQAEVDQFYSLFLQSVAAGRGSRLSAESARKTEARIFIGKDAVLAGLADDVGTFLETLGEIERLSSRRAAPRQSAASSAMVDFSRFEMDVDDRPTPAATTTKPTGGAADWGDIADEMNAQRGLPSKRQAADRIEPSALAGEADRRPAQKGAVPWSEIAAELAREAGVVKRVATRRG